MILFILTIISLATFKLVSCCKTRQEITENIEFVPKRPNNSQHNAVDEGPLEETEITIKLHVNPFAEINQRKSQSKKFFEKERNAHKNEAEALVSVKTKIGDPMICKRIFDDVNPGLLQKMTPKVIENLFTEIKKSKILLTVCDILGRTKTITLYYVDLLKDTLLAVRLLALLGVAYVVTNPTTFSSQIIFISMTATFLPIILSAFIIASDPWIVLGFHYRRKFRKMSNWKMLLTKLSAFIFFPIIPALLFDVKIREKENLKNLLMKSNHTEVEAEINERRKFLMAVKQKILTLKRLELTFEVVPQVTVLCLMILIKESDTNLETGLEAVFDVEPQLGLTIQAFLALNILWSLRTGVFTALRVKRESKGFIPVTGSILLLFKNTLTIITRITCIVFFFVPFLGCLNLATHWKAEQIKLGQYNDQFLEFTYSSSSAYKNVALVQFPENKLTFYYEGKVQIYDWRHIFRSNTRKIEYTEYTLMKLSVAYALFWGIMLLQLLAVTVFQVFFHRAFTVTGVLHKILHAVEHVHIFDTSDDWDEFDGCSHLQYKQRWERTKIELVLGIFFHWLINILLLCPILVTGYSYTKTTIILITSYFKGFSIRARHSVLQRTIGPFTQEVDAFNTASLLMWLLPLLVSMSTVLELVLLYLFNRFGHPWAGILADS